MSLIRYHKYQLYKFHSKHIKRRLLAFNSIKDCFYAQDFHLVRLTHRGDDGWNGREMHIYWTDGSRSDCQDEHIGWLDDNQHKDLNCDGPY